MLPTHDKAAVLVNITTDSSWHVKGEVPFKFRNYNLL